ncbi:MAG: SDR family oxidoreductase [Elusimicrobia bacterium]|nr:SDR family oxidoreductase [Elusimicrobiota bacterium]
MRVVVVGATGLLGHALWRDWRARPGWSVVGTSRAARGDLERLDMQDAARAAASLAAWRPDAVVIAASEPNVDFCESDPDSTRRVNVDATLDLAQAARAGGARVVFFSSDYVFDGSRGAWREDDPPAPLNEYGRQKLAVERALAGFGPDALVLRVSGLFGWEFKPRNFVLRARENLAAGRRLTPPDDQVYCPSYVGFLGGPVAALIEKRAAGLLHLAGAEPFARDAWGRAVARAFGLDAGLVDGRPTASLPSGAAPRPLRSDLDSRRAAELLGAALPGGTAGLERMKADAAAWLPELKAWAGGDVVA